MAKITTRAIQPSDFDAMHSMMSDHATARQLGSWPSPAQPAFTRTRAQPYRGQGFVSAICSDNVLKGWIAITAQEVGYCLHPDLRGQGIVSRLTSEAIESAFATYDWAHLNASCWHDNPASRAILTKRGFVHWQTSYERGAARRGPDLCYHFRLTRADWQARHG